MQINVTFRHTEPSEAVKTYAEEKLSRLKKYMDEPIEANIVLQVEKFRHIAEVSLDSNGMRVNATEETHDMYSAIDMVVDKLESQIKKQKEKQRNRKPSNSERNQQLMMNILEWPAEETGEPRVVTTRQIFAKPMDVDEAVMQLNLSNGDFLVFTNRASNAVNVLYRRKDGNYGLIEPVQ
ncbi:SSU ribosomal protein S30P/sigma 54 modulation protein [Desulfacinum infernum DSM 9756]|uniref:Ribosome hibernation promoting factor n=1 Tax=Desulfacinum infernum DSM 9756 TaxID=1121391 RepID=A0A1M5A3K8_9BACT|nr:ribosome-associated translation inhibitor RaiA [Desulfacinum infernum]SHF24526.1 SSU ribosomal protein S30P/sigma 54 modulation protein [Desulfacinum infernum DSM 9756]